jgi:hypothetical protein
MQSKKDIGTQVNRESVMNVKPKRRRLTLCVRSSGGPPGFFSQYLRSILAHVTSITHKGVQWLVGWCQGLLGYSSEKRL